MSHRRAAANRAAIRRGGDLEIGALPSLSTGQALFADWGRDTIRYFMVDGVSGNDANTGYADGAPDGTKAVKTLAAFLLKLPIYGCGRQFCCLIAGGGYAAQDLDLRHHTGYRLGVVAPTTTDTTASTTQWGATANDRIALGGVRLAGTDATGYRCNFSSLNITAISINADFSARCTVAGHGFTTGDKCYFDITNTTNNFFGLAGAHPITVVDANTFDVAGTKCSGTYSGTGYTVKRWKLTAIGGGAVALGDNETSQTYLGKRFRADANTATSALRNGCRTIWAYGADTIIPGNDLAATPNAATDVFYIEEPGTTINDIILGNTTASRGFLSGAATFVSNGGIFLAGFKCNRIGGNGWRGTIGIAFCEASNACDFRQGDTLQIATSYTDETGTSRTPGCGLRHTSGQLITVQLLNSTIVGYAQTHTSRFNVIDCAAFSVGQQCTMRVGGDIYGSGTGAGGYVQSQIVSRILGFGAGNTTIRGALVFACPTIAFVVAGSSCVVTGIEVQNCAGPAISIAGIQTDVTFQRAQGSRGNLQAGVDLVGGQGIPGNKNCFVGVIKTGATAAATETDSTVQLTGNYGDIRMIGRQGYTVYSWTQTSHQVLRDLNDNLVNLNNTNFGVDCRPGDVISVSRADGTTTLSAYRVVRVSGTFAITGAQANSEANAAGTIGVTQNDAITDSRRPNGNNQPHVTTSGLSYVTFDRSGAHPAPAAGGVAYLSVDTAQLAQADVPANNGVNRKVRLGTIVGLHATLANTALVALAKDTYSTLADGNP